MKVGDMVPEVLGVNEDGKPVKISDYKGRKVVLYFYPKDNTPGCTAEACSLRDNYGSLQEQGYEVIGVSADSQTSHQRFKEKQQLPFTLISDADKTLIEQMGCWGEKKMCGRTSIGILRTTFIIDEEGKIERIFTPKEIKTKIHAEQILG
ncbi:MAG: thioredoxin-dependent thiol peroxidase [Prevotella sp.]|nr:thioredoxin-dependent thiol peroxidase [Prevotella sp.]